MCTFWYRLVDVWSVLEECRIFVALGRWLRNELACVLCMFSPVGTVVLGVWSQNNVLTSVKFMYWQFTENSVDVDG